MTQWLNENLCKNHSDTEAGYFLVEQPWLKFCSVCALNMAICGKKIQKQLNSQQFQRKMALTQISNQIKRVLEMHKSGNNLNTFIEQLQVKYCKQISNKLRIIDGYISSLMKARDDIFEFYENQMSRKLNSFFQRQSKTILNSLQLKKQIEFIQSNLGNIIEIKEDTIFQFKAKRWTEIINNAKNDLPTEQQLINLQAKFKQKSLTIHQKLNTFDKLLLWKPNPLQKDNHGDSRGDISEVRDCDRQIRDEDKTDRSSSIEKIVEDITKRPIKSQLKLRSASKRSQNISSSKDCLYPIRTKRKQRKELFSVNRSILNPKLYQN